jgi:purine-cytosine permease-like protein
MWAAILIIAIGTIVVSFMGYKVVHLYEKWSWVPVSLLFPGYSALIEL